MTLYNYINIFILNIINLVNPLSFKVYLLIFKLNKEDTLSVFLSTSYSPLSVKREASSIDEIKLSKGF